MSAESVVREFLEWLKNVVKRSRLAAVIKTASNSIALDSKVT